jgi:hypothetical protein
MTNNRRGILIGAQDFGSFWIDLASAAALTTLGLHPVPGLPEDDYRSLESLIARMRTEPFLAQVRELGARGIELTVEAHAMRWLLPRNHFEAHPEWFRMNEEGARTPDLNLCPSSEPALRVVESRTEEAVERIIEISDGHRYHLWMDDNSRYCHCLHCQDLSASDQALLVYNGMLRGVRRADPQGTLAYLAYQQTLEAPARVAPSPGIFLEFAPVDRDSRFPMASPMIAKNVAVGSSIPELLACFGKEGSQILEYWMDDSYFYRWTLPYGELPFYRGVVRKDIRYYRSLGFQNITSFACGLNGEYEEEYGTPPVEEYGMILEEEFE